MNKQNDLIISKLNIERERVVKKIYASILHDVAEGIKKELENYNV